MGVNPRRALSAFHTYAFYIIANPPDNGKVFHGDCGADFLYILVGGSGIVSG